MTFMFSIIRVFLAFLCCKDVMCFIMNFFFVVQYRSHDIPQMRQATFMPFIVFHLMWQFNDQLPFEDDD